ncbi:hypothetical protein ICM05_10180 [Leucobacter sp. cx-42]|uniref:DUF6602 domain-containing protein n=1 Tax=unclassified Leucobacter TaxID=2621730 RepID=UPI00165E26EF|nr:MULTISPECIES: DUF6602 domain-containing protein [unclassified Leucobacter]MBC9954998.1 hypothetical protein [Leucobacter sp. cx-42]
MVNLVDIMTSVSKQLSTSIEASRLAFEHNLTKGEAVESAVRKFFRTHLPDSIGVAHGQVIDQHGAISNQLDVILYDSPRTPILFSDEESANRIVPVEGVIAAIEVKTSLKVGDIQSINESAKALKTLDKSAYFRQDSPLQSYTYAYGKKWSELPPMYFVLSFDGPTLDSVTNAMLQAESNSELWHRIDTVCILNRGVIANSDDNARGVDALPFPGSKRLKSGTEHPLLLFYILLGKYVLQTDLPPIALQRYLPSDFVF